MRNLKKVLALVLVMALSLSLIVMTGAAFNDVKPTDGDAQAIELLSSLKVLQGKENNNFDPDGNIKRSEFAAVVYRLMTGNENANRFNGTTDFSDVPANHWASGYINWATNNGIIGGYPDGTFKPDNNVTMAEATKMMVVALGYSQTKANGQPFDFPYDYLDLAERRSINLFKDVEDFGADDAAVRHVVSRMGYNALFADCYYNASKDGNGNLIKYTLAEETYDLASWEGQILNVSTAVVDNSTHAVGENEIYVAFDEVLVDGKPVDPADDAFEYANSSYELLGQKCTVWFQGKDVVNVSISADGEFITLPGGGTVDGTNYKVNGTTYKIGKDTDLTLYDIVNGTSNTKTTLAAIANDPNSLYTFVNADGNSDYEAVIKVEYKKNEIKTVNSAAKKINFGAGVQDLENVDIYADYKVEDVIYYTSRNEIVDDESVAKYTVTKAQQITGLTLEAITDDGFRMSGTVYEPVDGATVGDVKAENLGKEFVLTVNPMGYVIAAEAVDADDTTNYLYVKGVSQKANGGTWNADDAWESVTLTALLPDGTEKVFNVATDADIKDGAKALFTTAKGWMKEDGTTAATSDKDAAVVDNAYAYELNDDDEIDALTGIGASANGVVESKPGSKTVKFGASDEYYVDSDSIVYLTTGWTDGGDRKDIKFYAYKGADIPAFETEATASYSVKVKTENNLKYIETAVITVDENPFGVASDDVFYGRVKGFETVVGSESGKYAMKVEVYADGELKTFTTEDMGSDAITSQKVFVKNSYVKISLLSDGKIDVSESKELKVPTAGGAAVLDTNPGYGVAWAWAPDGKLSMSTVAIAGEKYTANTADTVAVSEDCAFYVVDDEGNVTVMSKNDLEMSEASTKEATGIGFAFDYILASTKEGDESSASPKIIAIFMHAEDIVLEKSGS